MKKLQKTTTLLQRKLSALLSVIRNNELQDRINLVRNVVNARNVESAQSELNVVNDQSALKDQNVLNVRNRRNLYQNVQLRSKP